MSYLTHAMASVSEMAKFEIFVTAWFANVTKFYMNVVRTIYFSSVRLFKKVCNARWNLVLMYIIWESVSAKLSNYSSWHGQ